MSLYSQYVEELLGDHVLEGPDGFVTYRYPDPKTVYILNIYVIPELRKQGFAARLADQVAVIAKEHGCTKMIGSVVPSARGSTASLKVLLAYGMKLDSSALDFIVFSKEI